MMEEYITSLQNVANLQNANRKQNAKEVICHGRFIVLNKWNSSVVCAEFQ